MPIPQSDPTDEIIVIDLTDLRPHPENASIFGDPQEARQYEEIRDSIKKNGLWEPIVVSPDRKILSGHLRVCALKELGETRAPCRVMTFASYRREVEFIVRSNTDRRHLTPEQIAYAFDRLRRIPREEGGTKRKMGRPAKGEEKSGAASGVSDSRDEAAAIVGVGQQEARALSTVFCAPDGKPSTDVPREVKDAVNAGRIAPTPAAEMVRSERKRQGGEIADPAPIKAWAEQKIASKATTEPAPVDDHEQRIAEEARRFSSDMAELIEAYKAIDRVLTRRPLKSVLGPTDHHEYGSLVRDIALRAWREVESVQGDTKAGRQMSLSVIAGGKS